MIPAPEIRQSRGIPRVEPRAARSVWMKSTGADALPSSLPLRRWLGVNGLAAVLDAIERVASRGALTIDEVERELIAGQLRARAAARNEEKPLIERVTL